MKKHDFTFTDENIRAIFGAFDGEGEDIERLKEYYFKTDIYTKIISDLPVKILVGQKGIGKSALFRIAIAETKETEKLPILIKPDDIAEIGERHESLILSIRKWKFGLTDIIIRKTLNTLGIHDESATGNIIRFGGKIMPVIADSIEKKQNEFDLTVEQLEAKDSFLKHRKIVIFLDDLDRGWQNRAEGLVMISALINSIRDMSSENEGISFKLALRSDVYFAVRTADESSDKFEGLVVHHHYSLHEIFVLLIKRILTFFNENFNEANLMQTSQKHLGYNLEPIFDKLFLGRGKWYQQPMYKVLLSLIRNRPRDLVKLCTLAAQKAFSENSKIIKTQHIEAILPIYSKSIIDDTIAEYKSELPHIERLIYGMKPSKVERNTEENFVYSTSALQAKLFNLIQLGEYRFASGQTADPKSLRAFLYKINFLTARKTLEDGTIRRKNFEQSNHISSAYIDFGFDWEIHLAYRWMLQPESLDDIFAKISQ